MNKDTLVALLITVFLAPWYLASSYAQAPAHEIVVLHTVAEEGTDALNLSVYFTIVDANGRPVPKEGTRLGDATIALGNEEGTEADVKDPESPIYIVLLLDASGSMQSVMGKVQEAAAAAVDHAPPNAHFAVYQFNETATLLQEFTDDPQLVKTAIRKAKSVHLAPTCMYDTAYGAIDALDKKIQAPHERRAIILFTDGRDTNRDETAPCSSFTDDQVIAKATTQSRSKTPIYTIGLCKEDCSNIDQTVLEKMARETSASWATGEQENLDASFEEIMDALNSQWQATAPVLAREGENSAYLRVSYEDERLQEDILFTSGRDYTRSLVTITGVEYDSTGDSYKITLEAKNAGQIQEIVVEAWSEAGGDKVQEKIFKDVDLSQPLVFETNERFETEEEYRFEVKAKDASGSWIETKTDRETTMILAEHSVTYQGDVAFEIRSVTTDSDWNPQDFTIKLNIQSTTDDAFEYHGSVQDQSGAERVVIEEGELARCEQSPCERSIQVPIQNIRTREGTYVVVLDLWRQGEREKGVTTQTKEFAYDAPGFFARLATFVFNPVVLVIIVLVLVGVVGFIVYQRRPKEQEVLLPPHAPPTGHLKGNHQQILIKVVETPDASQKRELVVDQFPCVLGRGTRSHVPITGDTEISREHVQITVKDRQFYLTDQSVNGTSLDGVPLEPGIPTLLDRRATLQLGQFTYLELDPTF
jgi:hypothetical protein